MPFTSWGQKLATVPGGSSVGARAQWLLLRHLRRGTESWAKASENTNFCNFCFIFFNGTVGRESKARKTLPSLKTLKNVETCYGSHLKICFKRLIATESCFVLVSFRKLTISFKGLVQNRREWRVALQETNKQSYNRCGPKAPAWVRTLPGEDTVTVTILNSDHETITGDFDPEVWCF